jgi:hypothetical protein
MFVDLLQFETDCVQPYTELVKQQCSPIGSFADQGEEQVRGADVFVVEADGFHVGQIQDSPGGVAKGVAHGCLLWSRAE